MQLYNLLRMAVEDRYLLFTQILFGAYPGFADAVRTPPAKRCENSRSHARHLCWCIRGAGWLRRWCRWMPRCRKMPQGRRRVVVRRALRSRRDPTRTTEPAAYVHRAWARHRVGSCRPIEVAGSPQSLRRRKRGALAALLNSARWRSVRPLRPRRPAPYARRRLQAVGILARDAFIHHLRFSRSPCFV